MAQEANIVIRLSDGKQAGETLKALKQDANRLTREIGLLKPGTDAVSYTHLTLPTILRV